MYPCFRRRWNADPCSEGSVSLEYSDVRSQSWEHLDISVRWREATSVQPLMRSCRNITESSGSMRLEGYCSSNGKEQKSRAAFNDIIIHRGTNPSVKTLIIRVNGEYLNTYVGDGIIVATPSGSTAYNMSAGGPIVDPKAKLLLVTPINSHSLNAKSIVLSADDEIEIEISARNHETDDSAEVSFDGDYPIKLGFGDKIVIKKAEQATNILKLSKLSFLEILSKKMQTCI